jgi:pilus assembly protein CpaF
MKPHVVRLEARPPNIEGLGAITIRDLVRNSLRMRPDRIVIGECRGGEALDMLQAMNTGHDGSITTGHANSPRDMLRRLETMVLLSGVEIPVRAIREQIASAIDTGMGETQILLQEVFRYSKNGGPAGKAGLVPTGVPSKFYLVEGNGWE